jgi:hypothetical protein
MRNIFSSPDCQNRRRGNLIPIGLTALDLDYLIKLLDEKKQQAVEELHQFAMQSDQRGQGKSMERFKTADNLKTYLADRLEAWLNNMDGGE